MTQPLFLKKLTCSAPKRSLDKVGQEYRQLLGIWLIDLALMLGWHQPIHRRSPPDIFCNENFCALTGLECRDDEDTPSTTVVKASTCRALLLKQREILQSKRIAATLPLFTNLKLLSTILGMTEADQALLAFITMLTMSQEFRSVIADKSVTVSNLALSRILSSLTGLPARDFLTALSDKGVLVSTSIVKVKRSDSDIEVKLDLIEGFAVVLMSKHNSADELVGRFLKRAAQPTLGLVNFPHLASDSEILQKYVRNAVDKKTVGVNILLHGKPGVGKTEYIQALAAELAVDLYEVAFSSESGEPIKGEARLRAYTLCQRILANSHNSLLLFDYSIKFPLPPMAIRLDIARHHFDCFKPSRGWLERIASNEEISPGQFASAAKVARISNAGNNVKALELVERTLERSATLLGQKCLPARNIVRTGYSLDYLNTDVDLSGIVAGLKRRPRGTFCFYGAAGTGKSELARHISDEIGRPFLLRRASDILSKWVGESEQNIAAMFSEARQQNAVLVLDEADSFLSDRRDAQRSWEVTQVNELLTQMEAFDGIFICTTNLMEKLDPACLRRFAFKVCFKPLTPDQRWGMFRQELERLGGSDLYRYDCESQVRELDRLTPGDFAVAVRQFELYDISATADKLYELLRKECEAKGQVVRKIGFNVNN